MVKKTQDLFKAYVTEGRAPGTPSIKRYTRSDGTTALKSLNKWGKRKDWRDSEGGLAKAKEHAGVDKISEDVACSEPITTDPNLPTSRLIGTDSVVRIFKAGTPGQSPEQIQEGLTSLAARGLSAARGLVSRVITRAGRRAGTTTPAATATTRSARVAAAFPQSARPAATATTTSPRVAAAFPQATRLAPAAVSSGVARRGVSVLGKAARVIPGLQTATGLGLAAYNAYKGDWVGAGLSLGSAIPGPVGWAFTGAEVARQLTGTDSSSSRPAASRDTVTTASRPTTPAATPAATPGQPAAPASPATRGATPGQPAAPAARSTTPGQPAAATPSQPASNVVRTVKTKGGDYNVYRKDSDEAKSFRSEFARNRRSGAKEFTWQGRKYSTAVAESNDLNESFEMAFDYQGKPQLAPTAGQLMMHAKGAFAHHTDVQNVVDVQSIKEAIQKQFEQTVLEEDTELLEQKCEILGDMVNRALERIQAIKESNVERDAWSEAEILKLESYIESVAKYLDNISEDSVPVMRRSYMRTDPRTGERKRVWGRPYKRKRDFNDDDEDDKQDLPRGPLSV